MKMENTNFNSVQKKSLPRALQVMYLGEYGFTIA